MRYFNTNNAIGGDLFDTHFYKYQADLWTEMKKGVSLQYNHFDGVIIASQCQL
jgi:hypothetical protein